MPVLVRLCFIVLGPTFHRVLLCEKVVISVINFTFSSALIVPRANYTLYRQEDFSDRLTDCAATFPRNDVDLNRSSFYSRSIRKYCIVFYRNYLLHRCTPRIIRNI